MAESISKRDRMILEALINRNAELMRELSIESPEDMKKALGDYYDGETRKTLMALLSDEDRAILRKIYLLKCKAGRDRSPACIKVTVEWEHNAVWTVKEHDYLITMKAVFDRFDRQVKYHCKTHNSLSAGPAD